MRYLWGTTSCGYTVAAVEAALGGPAPDTWTLVFDPKYAAKLADCGIALVDATSSATNACASSGPGIRPMRRSS